jgi:fido (protein-threonine AMPylation protein)
MNATPWYTRYSDIQKRVTELKVQFIKRCEALGVSPSVVASEVWNDLVIRAVHESNWQEGIYVERGKTRELALHVFEALDGISGPHIDLDRLLSSHKQHVISLKRKHFTIDEIAAYNLSAAHVAITWIGAELASRQATSIIYALRKFKDAHESGKFPLPNDTDAAQRIREGFKILDDLVNCEAQVKVPMTGGAHTEGALLQKLLQVDFNELLHPMRLDYVHCLHRLVLMGVSEPHKCGHFRKIPVHVGNPDILFPTPSLIPGMMQEFCRNFPTILPNVVKYDPILTAAKVSHRFVRIHPYCDGNGRVSRLLMNLVLWQHHPPIYLKADSKGRHRYGQALKRADRGNIEPLACLIAQSLVEVYEMLISSVSTSAARHAQQQ